MHQIDIVAVVQTTRISLNSYTNCRNPLSSVLDIIQRRCKPGDIDQIKQNSVDHQQDLTKSQLQDKNAFLIANLRLM